MDIDLAFTLGCLFVFFAIPALVSGYSEQQLSRLGVVLLLIGGGGIGYALMNDAARYSPEAVPEIFLHVFARFYG